MAKKVNAESVSIKQPDELEIVLEVGGLEYIQNKFSQKSVEQMLRKQMGLSTTQEPKKPRECIEDAKIKNAEGRICIPPQAFKAGMLTAAGTIKGMVKTKLRQWLYVYGNSIPITYDAEIPRMDIVRLPGINKVPDLRFRPMFTNWRARVAIRFTDNLNVQSVVDLINRAGRVGVGEWRPEKNGPYGTYEVTRVISDKKEIAQVLEECASPIPPLIIPEWAMNAEITPELLKKIMGSQQNAG